MKTEIRASGNAIWRGLAELWRAWLRISQLRIGRRSARSLRLCESLALGERRFVAVVEFEESRFLLGGTPSSLVLLSRLPDAAVEPAVEPETEPVSAARYDTQRLAIAGTAAAEIGVSPRPAAMGMERIERRERMERPERTERTERTERRAKC